MKIRETEEDGKWKGKILLLGTEAHNQVKDASGVCMALITVRE